MSYEEIEIDARLLEINEQGGGYDSMDDEELVELIEQINAFQGGDLSETYEYLLQYSNLDEKRFISLCEY